MSWICNIIEWRLQRRSVVVLCTATALGACVSEASVLETRERDRSLAQLSNAPLDVAGAPGGAGAGGLPMIAMSVRPQAPASEPLPDREACSDSPSPILSGVDEIYGL